MVWFCMVVNIWYGVWYGMVVNIWYGVWYIVWWLIFGMVYGMVVNIWYGVGSHEKQLDGTCKARQ